jgi:hypothetical protein
MIEGLKQAADGFRRWREKDDEVPTSVVSLIQLAVALTHGEEWTAGLCPLAWCSCGEPACRSDRFESGLGKPVIHSGRSSPASVMVRVCRP